MSAREPSITAQTSFWNDWNTRYRAESRDVISQRQAQVVESWLHDIGRLDLRVLDLGCGSGWLTPTLLRFGPVTATDLADEAIGRAREKHPSAEFLAGDVMELDLPRDHYDVVVALEVLSHVADQPAFVDRVAGLLRPGGRLMLATQNRPVLERLNTVPPPGPGQLRHWVDAAELRALVAPRLDVQDLFSVTPRADRGIWRWLNSARLNRGVRRVAGDDVQQWVERWKEQRLGLGWTLMCRAVRP